jgi:Tol biopolymer transport system component
VRTSKPVVFAALTALLLLAFVALGGSSAPAASFPGANGRIAYASNQSGSWQVYTMNADGSGKTQLTAGPGDSTQPSFSADGGRIAFASNRAGSYDIYTMNADGSGVTRLTSDPGADTQPSFSPDGSQIAFIGKRETSWYGHVYLMNADGTNQIRLNGQFGSEERPTFSPDGRVIALGRIEQKHRHIFTMNTAGGELAALTQGAFDDRQPTFSPNGQRIAFSSRREGRAAIFTMRSDGSDVTGLTSDLSSVQPAYSPDGRQIAFVSGGGIRAIGANGGGEVRLTTERGSQAWPSWQPLVGPSNGPSHGSSHGPGAASGLRIGRPILNRRQGTAKLPVTVPAAGTISLRGKQVKPRRRHSVAGAATVKLLVKPKAGAAKALTRKGKAKVKVVVTYARKGGGVETASKTFALVEKRRP